MSPVIEAEGRIWQLLHDKTSTWQIFVVKCGEESSLICGHDQIEAFNSYRQANPDKQPEAIERIPLEEQGFFLMRWKPEDGRS